MTKTALQIAAALLLLCGGCSALVKADRSKVPDDLYRPADFGDGGDAAGPDGEDAESDAGTNDDGDGLDGGVDAADATNPTEAGDDGPLDQTGDLPLPQAG